MASPTFTSTATFTSSVAIDTTVQSLSATASSGQFSPRPFEPSIRTRSSTGSLVKSTHMRVRVSPDKPSSMEIASSCISSLRDVPERSPTHSPVNFPSASNETAVTKVTESSPKTPPLAPVTVPSSSGGLLHKTSPLSVYEFNSQTQFNRSSEQILNISHLTERIDALEADRADQTIYNLLQNDKIRKLEKRVAALEGDLLQMNAKFAVRDHVVEALRNEVHRLQQYTRRYSVVVAGIEKKKDETPESLREEVLKLVSDVDSTSKEQDIDKFHRNGRVYNGKEQEIIVRFKSHAAKEAFYRARKNLPASRKAVKIRPSLSPNQKNLLRDAQAWVEQFSLNAEMVNPVQYVFANIHGEIQAKMQKNYRGSPFISFNSIQDLASRLKDAQVVRETDRAFDEMSARYDTDSNIQTRPHNAEVDDNDDMGFNGL